MSQINRVPFGLQDLLGSQNFGDNPSEFGGVVAPTLDMTPFLTAERTSYYHNTAGISGNQALGTATVPEGEIWYLLSAGVGVQPSGGLPVTAYGCRVTVFAFNLPTSSTPSGSHAIADLVFDNPTPTALSTERIEHKAENFPIPIPMFSGASIRFWLTGTYGILGWTTNITLRYLKAKQ